MNFRGEVDFCGESGSLVSGSEELWRNFLWSWRVGLGLGFWEIWGFVGNSNRIWLGGNNDN